MQSVIFAKKGKTSQVFDSKLNRLPSTTLFTNDVFFVGLKTQDTKGYNSFVFTYGKSKSMDKPTVGSLKKSGVSAATAVVKEARFDASQAATSVKAQVDQGEAKLYSGDTHIAGGTKVDPSLFFKVGDFVDVAGTSKGKGFQGGVKRHRFKGGPKTHGQSDRWRAPGSVGATTTPGRTFKGQRMAGRMGGTTITVKRLKVLAVTPDSLQVAGLVPGVVSGYVKVSHSKEKN